MANRKKEIDDILIEQMPEDLGIVGFESFKKAYQAGLLKGKIGEQLTRAFVQEAVRPILGGIGGFAVGTILGEDRNDQFMTAAIAIGVTATLGAPIGGVLFSIEVSTLSFSVSNLWKSFFASTFSILLFKSAGL